VNTDLVPGQFGLCKTCDWNTKGVVSGSAYGHEIFCDAYREKRVVHEVRECPKHIHSQRHPDESIEQFDSRKVIAWRATMAIIISIMAIIISILALLATAANAWVNYLRYQSGH